MTKDDYLASNDPRLMLRFLENNVEVSDRKLRLIAVAGCRYVWELLTDERSRSAVEVAERFADGEAVMSELEDALDAANMVIRYDSERYLVGYGPTIPPAFAARDAADERGFWAARATTDNLLAERSAYPTAGNVYNETPYSATERESIRRCLMDVLRDISGFPFLPVTIDPHVLVWHDSTIPRLAQAIYDERQLPDGTFDPVRMNILADALLDAGCDNEDIIAHCRSDTSHMRGCWAVDLLLGKE